MNIIEAIHDPALFRPLFRNLDTWRAWFVVLRAIFGLPMDDADLLLYRQLTGRDMPPQQQVQECWIVAGRRGGKSFVVAVVAVFLGCFRNYRPYLGPGERGVIMIVATDRRQARIIHRYIRALLNAVPMLAAMIDRQDSESIDLNNGITIEIHTGSFRAVRGYTIVAFLGDETPFWRSEDSANPAEELLASVRPAMATIPNPLLICIGSPYRRSGVMYDAWKKYYGQQDAEVLVLQADTRTMNPTVNQAIIDRAFELDPINASAEYGAQFRSDVGSFLDADLAEQAIEPGCRERLPVPGVRYRKFIDVAEGVATTGDWIAMGIAHLEPLPIPRSRAEEQAQKLRPPQVILDAIRWVKPPFNPEHVVAECFAPLIKRYSGGGHEVVGDRVSQGWVGPAFARHGIIFKPSELTKSEIYLHSLPLFTSGSIDLLDVPQLRTQLLQLERRTHRSGRDHVDHPPHAGAHDDVVNAALGAAVLCTQRRPEIRVVKLLGF